MLRNYLGNEAFYKGLNIYLTKNAFKSAETQQLRLAMEEASGFDLNWFFNQWYYGAGHPVLDISYQWDEVSKTETVILTQNQDGQLFKLPIAIDLYAHDGKIDRHRIMMNTQSDTLRFKMLAKPDLVNVDADKILISQKTDHKTADEYAFQYFHAPLYLDRYEALEFASKNQDNKTAQKIIIAVLHDRFSGLRSKAVQVLNMNKEDIRNINPTLKDAAIPELANLAQKDENTLVRTSALVTLASLKDPSNLDLFKKALTSQSYKVEAAGLHGINEIDPNLAMQEAAKFENDNEGDLTQQIVRVYATAGGDAKWPYVYNRYINGTLQEQIHLTEKFSEMIGRLKKITYVLQGIEELKQMGIKYKKDGAAPYISKYLANIKNARTQQNDLESAKTADTAIKEISDAK